MPAIRPIRTIVSIAWFLATSTSQAFASRYCDLCGEMPWWEEPLLVVTRLLIAVAILAGFVRLGAWSAQRRALKHRRAPSRSRDSED